MSEDKTDKALRAAMTASTVFLWLIILLLVGGFVLFAVALAIIFL